jgi:hypothetical protein
MVKLIVVDVIIKIVILSEVSQAQKAKNHMFSLICRPKTNAVILLDMGHTLRGEHIHEE